MVQAINTPAYDPELRASLADRIPVYVAGKYNDTDVFKILANMRRGFALTKEVFGIKGVIKFSPFCPWFDYHLPLMDEEITYTDMLEYSLAWLCRAKAVLVVHKNWWTSKGTNIEIEEAKKLGIPVFFKLQDLINWARNQRRT